MASLWMPDISIAEKVLRSVVVYVFMVVAFRLTGKRQVGQLTPFDLVVLFILSNVVQNALIGNDNSLGGGLLGAAAILGINRLFVEATYWSKRLRHIIEPGPTSTTDVFWRRTSGGSASRATICMPRCGRAV